MTSATLFVLTGVALFAIGLHALFVRAHLFWKIMALNVIGSGAFLVLAGAMPGDAVPQALVLTGIVVTVAATALALALALRVVGRTGQPYLPEDRTEPGG
jgi:multicomponent Na+:H+ antiporter subunit C